MFKLAICLFVIAAGANAATIGRTGIDVTTEKREIIPLLHYETDKSPDGSYNFSFEGGDQSARQEQGTLKNKGTDDEALEVSGSYRYVDDDGQVVEVTYTAGKNGFVPMGTRILDEITAAAKAAADLPRYSEEEERQERLSQRRARSQTDEPKPVETKPVELKAAESQVVPVQVLPESKPVEQEKSEKVVEKTA